MFEVLGSLLTSPGIDSRGSDGWGINRQSRHISATTADKKNIFNTPAQCQENQHRHMLPE